MRVESRHRFSRGWAIFLHAGGLWLERNAFVHRLGATTS